MSELIQVTDDVWAIETPIKMPGGMILHTRMTVVRLPDGKLWVHSPIRLDDATAKSIEALGEVAHIVAPNRYHHLFFGACAERYPQARTFGPPGLAEKVPSLRVDEVLSDSPPAVWATVFDQHVVAGAAAMSELVFLHKPSRTLVVSDLLFNIVRPANFMAKVVTTIMGTRGKLARSRVWKMLIKDKPAFDASVRTVLGWDFDKLIMAHGDVVQSDARSKARAAIGL
jgi:hypothetical protein